MRQELKVIVPLSEFMIRCGDAKLGFLGQYGIGTEDITLAAMKYKLQHIIPVERVWFEHYMDTERLQALWQGMQGNPGCRVPFQGFLRNYIDALYLMYTLYFNYYQMLFDAHHIPVMESGVIGDLRISHIKWMGSEDILLHMLYDPPVSPSLPHIRPIIEAFMGQTNSV